MQQNSSFLEESLESDKMDRDKNAEVKDVKKSTMNEKVNVQSGYKNEYGSNRYSSGPVHMIPGQLTAPGQLIDPGINFASVHGLTPVTVHMSFSLPRGIFKRRVTGYLERQRLIAMMGKELFLSVRKSYLSSLCQEGTMKSNVKARKTSHVLRPLRFASRSVLEVHRSTRNSYEGCAREARIIIC